MYDHIGLKVKDLDAAIRFYCAALEPLGHVLCCHDATSAGLGPKGAPALWLYASPNAKTQPGTHVAFAAPTRRAVDGFHRGGTKAGGKDNGKSGLREDYSPTYYAAFLIDPDGNNVEAVCMTAESR
jgi:catechol 2,3-dioxygenase-like lactoylglutathione lyase family enzyme